MKYSQVMIRSELRTQALRLLDHLIRKRLIFDRTWNSRCIICSLSIKSTPCCQAV
jgi:hypothetical protein